MSRDQESSNTPLEMGETVSVDWEARWTRKDRSDHLLFVPTASDRKSIQEFLVVDPATLVDLSQWR